jgi:Yip1 domain/zinc-ribbon domain
MLCPKCNQPVADGVRFCASCGEPLSPAGNPDATLIRPPPAGGGAAAAAWANANTALPGLIERIKKILLSPKTEWPVIESEPTTIAELYKSYAIPLAAFSALMSFLRLSVIGISFGFGSIRVPLGTGLVWTVVNFIMGLIGLYLFGLIIDFLAPTFSGQRDRRQALKTAAYTFTPVALGSVLGLLPELGRLLQFVAALYAIYLLYLGLPLLMRSPKEKAVGYTIATIICAILASIVLVVVMSFVGRITGFSPYGFGGFGGGYHGVGMTQEERQQRAAAAVGQIIGGALGTDQSGKADLGAAINNLAAAGRKMEQEQHAQAGDATQPAAHDPAAAQDPAAATQNAAAATAGLLTALGGAMGGNRHVDPVDFHTLKGLLPESLPGMQRTNAEGSSQQTMGMKGSQAVGDYQGQGGARAQIKIVDAAAVSGLINVAQSFAANQTSESDSGYEKQANVGGRLVHEKYDNNSKHGELDAIVAKRFAVDVTGDGIDMSTLEQYASLVDFSKLEAMKDAGAAPQ